MNDSHYTRLWWKLVATTLGFSLIPLVALGLTVYYQVHVSYTAKIEEMLRNRAENRRNTIDLFFDERIAQLTVLAYTNSFDKLTSEGYLDQVTTLMQSRSKSFVDLGIIDQEGNHVAYSGPYKLKGVNYKNEEWFHEVMMRGSYISDVFTGFRKFPHFIIAILRRDGDHSWILRATIDTEIFNSMVRAAQVGKGGDAFVVNANSVYQTPPRFGGQLLGHAEFLDVLNNIPKFTGTNVESMAIKGSDSLVATTWLKNKDWLLVIKEDPREELLPLFHVRHVAIALGVAGVLLIVGGTIFVNRLMIKQLIKSEHEKAILDETLIQSSKMAALGKLAAGIAHEVNNPLAVIKEKVGWMKDLLAEEDVKASENFQEFEDAVKKIDQHIERAKKVTHRLLGFARRMEPIQEKVDINKLLDETIEFLTNEAHYRNIRIEKDYSSASCQTLSDTAQLQQVFLNILNNGLDAIGKDGEIRVRTSLNPQDKLIVISISDNGPGIPRDALNKIFDPFFTTKEVGKGTGLGLSISYSIIEKLGGRIMVASEEGKGATFTIYLPQAVESGAVRPASAVAPTVPGRNVA